MAFIHQAGFRFPTRVLKSTAANSGARVGAYGILFSGPSEAKDLQGEYFTAQTDFGPRFAEPVPTLLNHGQPLKKGLEAFASIILPSATPKKDSVGVFVEITLDLFNDPFHEAISQLIEKGALRWSSGSAPQFVKRADDGRLIRWIPVEFSLTPCPCEPRLPKIRHLGYLN